MLVSYKWIKELTGTEKSAEALALDLTMQGLEVSSIKPVREDLGTVVVGRIVAREQHPNADLLSLLRVTTGGEPMEIVCGATNMKPGDKVAVAFPGTVLADGTKLKKAKIRGVISNGMCCSEDEIGLGSDHSGIIILPEDTPVGKPFREVMGFDDSVLELEITANRSDALSHIGIAREVAAAEGRPFAYPQMEVPEVEEPASQRITVEIEAADLCQRYAGRVVTGVKIGPSPQWMRQRLEICGIRAINNIVDVTNYVLLEYGHPLHAFDLDLLEGRKIIVRRARKGETIVTLDGVERKLGPEMMVIADAERPVAIAGIMGGGNSEVSGNTGDVLIESAYFNPRSIRSTRKTLGLSTEASYRFERGCDYRRLIDALDYAAKLMAEIAGGAVLKGRADTRAVPPEGRDPAEPIEICLRPERVSAVLGASVTRDETSSILRNLGFDLYPEPDGQIRVAVPSHRNDVTREIDLIEEVARLHGYDRIPSTLAKGRTRPGRPDPKTYFENRIREIMTACGYCEANSYCFEGDSTFDKLGFPKDDNLRNMIRIMNPISAEENGLRTTLIPSMIRSLSLNARRGNVEAALFEVAGIHLPVEPDMTQGEVRVLAFGAYGPMLKPWDGEERERDFFDARGVVDEVFRRIGMDESAMEPVSLPFLHPGRAAEVRLGERRVGIVGELSPAVRKEYDLRGRVILGELDLDDLMKEARFWPESFQPYSAYPPVARDLALVADRSVRSAAIERIIRELSKDLLESLTLFDLYQGEHLPKGKRGLAFRMVYRSPHGTLSDEKVNQLQERIVKRLKQELDVTLRE